MESCHDYETSIERMLADEIDDTERDRLFAHSERCRSCREFVELHHRLLGSELDLELPTDEELADVRTVVLERIRAEREMPAVGFGDLLRQLWSRPAWIGAAAAAMLVALVGGIWIGSRAGTGTMSLVETVDTPFAATIEPVNGNALYSNVSVRDAGDGTLTVGYDVTRHVELTRPPGHPQVRQLLLQSMLNEPQLGARLEAMTAVQTYRTPEVKLALIRSLLNDPDLAVRQRALEILTGYEIDADVETAMIAVLTTEQSVHLRLMALDQLAVSDLSPERVEQMLGDLERRDDRALLVRAGSYFPATEGVKQ